MSVRLGISVEGQTEERFVKDLLAPYLVRFGVHATPRNLNAYVQIYEFEGLLLSDPAIAAGYFEAPEMEPLFRSVVSRAGSPEGVNEGQTTAPSKRLEAWTRQYGSKRIYTKSTKTLHGPTLATRLTLPVIRDHCPRFAAWLSQLELLARL